jgi:chromosome segregation ATPase
LFKGEVETAELRKALEGEVERLSVELTSAQHDHAMEVAALRDQLAKGEALIADQQGGLAAQLREMGEVRHAPWSPIAFIRCMRPQRLRGFRTSSFGI